MRILFCGSGTFGVPALGAVAAAGHEVAAVVTQPDRPAGRGGRLRPTPVAEQAGRLGLAVRAVEDINAPAVVDWIGGLKVQAICVVDFGQRITQAVRSQASLDAFNLHGSLLPELRGAAPVNWAIIRGCSRTGVTTFSLVDRMDAGPIWLQAATDIAPQETAEELRARLAELGADLVCRTLELLEGGQARPREQDDSRATRAPLLKKTDGVIDWTTIAEAIVNRIRGTWPWPGAQAVFHRWDGSATPVTIARAGVRDGQGEPGCVGSDLCVAAGRQRVHIEQIQPAGRRLMGWRDFVNGYRVQPGDRFEPPRP